MEIFHQQSFWDKVAKAGVYEAARLLQERSSEQREKFLAEFKGFLWDGVTPTELIGLARRALENSSNPDDDYLASKRSTFKRKLAEFEKALGVTKEGAQNLEKFSDYLG